MNHYVYEVTNLINGRKYIGKRSCKCNIEDDKYMGSGYALREAINKYGKENFKKDILKVLNNEEEALEYEREVIKNKNACKSLEYYNIAEGGIGGNMILGKTPKEISEIQKKRSINISGEKHHRYGKQLSLEHKEKISSSNKEDWKNNAKRLNAIRYGENNHNYGKPLSEEHRNKIKKALIGREKSQDEKENIRKSKMGKKNPMYGKKFTEEHKNKLSESRKGEKHWNYGKAMSEENKQRLSELWKGKRMGADNPTSKSVICITTGKVFSSIAEAGREYNIKSTSNISACCNGRKKTCGKLKGMKLQWLHYDEYLKGIEI